jgi:hypothetical protein
LGGFKKTEINYFNEKITDPREYFYPYHLGRLGLVKINELVEPNICYISEFGEELKGYREDIARIYRDAFKNKILFFPADIGLTFYFKSQKMKVITAVDLEKKELDWGECPPEEVETCLLLKDYSLHYFKQGRNCAKDKLVQILGDHYEKSNS